jgi:hypothetical protein
VASALYVVPPLLLIAVLLVSAVAKIRDPRDTTSVFRQLGIPDILLRLPAPRLLPYAELVLAALLAALAPGLWYVVAATATLLLFTLYFLVILRALRLPYPVTCPCFGRLGLGEVTGLTLARNGVLLALALATWVSAWRGDSVAHGLRHLDDRTWWVAAVVAVAVAVLLVVRRHTRPSGRRPGLPPPPTADSDPGGYQRIPTPDGVLLGPNGALSVWELSDSAARLLVFCDPDRDAAVVEWTRGWASQLAPVLVHVVVESTRELASPGEDDLHDPGGTLRQALRVDAPGAVLLGTDRMLAGGPANGLAELTELVDAMAAELGVTDPR